MHICIYTHMYIYVYIRTSKVSTCMSSCHFDPGTRMASHSACLDKQKCVFVEGWLGRGMASWGMTPKPRRNGGHGTVCSPPAARIRLPPACRWPARPSPDASPPACKC